MASAAVSDSKLFVISGLATMGRTRRSSYNSTSTSKDYAVLSGIVKIAVSTLRNIFERVSLGLNY
jgi:hypothetical protein